MLPNIFCDEKGKRRGTEAPVMNGELDIRTLAEYIAKLRAVLDDATREAPRSVDIGEIEHRILLLQGTIEEVNNKKLDLTKQKELLQQEKYLKTVYQLMQQEAELNAKQAKNNDDKILAVKQAKEEAAFYFKDKNEKIEERMKKCLAYRQKADAEISVKAAQNEKRRTQNLENLYARREQIRAEAKERARKRQQYAWDVVRSREEMKAQKNRNLAEMSKLREQEVEEKLEAIRESRKSKWVAKGISQRAQSQVVWENGTAIIAQQLKDHDQLLKDLEEKEKSQKERYAGENAERLFYIKQEQQLLQEREMKVMSNLVQQANKRLKRGEQIIEDQKKKIEKGEKAIQKERDRQEKNREELEKKLALHKRRAAELEEERKNRILMNTFKRWNHRAARIVTNLRDAMDEDKENQYVPDDPWRNNTQTVVDAPSEKRPIRLPSPSDFEV